MSIRMTLSSNASADAPLSDALFRAPPEGRVPFSTLELGATVSSDDAALARLTVRAAVAGGAAPSSVRTYAAGDAADAWGRYSWHVWWAPPSRWRGDLTWPAGATDVSVVRDGAALVYLPVQQLMYTSEPVARDPRWDVVRTPTGIFELPTVANRHAVFPLLHPPLPASEWDFATVAHEVAYGGRVTRRVRATRRAGAPAAKGLEASGIWPGVDEYECLVDDALQILLRVTGIADSVPVATISVDHVRVDALFPDDVFAFVPPPGTRIVHVAGPS
jgi:hypothetical protein